jgi:hypothetical protein
VSRVESIERDIQKLSAEELADLRRWLATFDTEVRDRKFDDDVRAGKLDERAEWALRDHATGESTGFRPTTRAARVVPISRSAVDGSNDGPVWFWAGSHAEYDRLVG